MSTHKVFAVFGASGNVGSQVLRAFALHPTAASLEIRILTRYPFTERLAVILSSTAAAAPRMRILVRPIDYDGLDTHAQLVAALRGVDVVISTVGDDSRMSNADIDHVGELPGFRAQEAVARAASEVGVRLFVPAEYGFPTHTLEVDSPHFMRGKRMFLDFLRNDLALPWLVVYAGSFPDKEPEPTPLLPCTSMTPKALPPFWTTRYHLASYLVSLLVDSPRSETTWAYYRILGQRRERLVTRSVNGEDIWGLREG